MRKRGKKLVAMALATSMALGTVSMQAFADEPIVDTKVVENEDGTTTNHTIVTTPYVDPETGKVTVEVKIDGIISGENHDGATVEGTMTETTVTETTTDAEGNVTGTVKVDGSETTVAKNEATVDDLKNVDFSDVKMDLDPSEDEVSTTGPIVEVVEVSNVTSDILNGNNVDIGDKTVIEEIERVVKAELSQTTTENKSTVGYNPVVAPEKYDGKEYDPNNLTNQSIWIPEKQYNTTMKDYDALRGDSVVDKNYEKDPEVQAAWGAQPEEYEFIIAGQGEVTDAAAPAIMEITYKKDEEGNLILGEDGNPVIESTRLIPGGNRGIANGMDDQTSMISVKRKKEDGTFEYFYAYCVDSATPAPNINTGYYKVSDIEDAGYYDDAAAEKIRAIAENGYWGTEEGTGSLASIKEMLKQKYDVTAVIEVDGASMTYGELIDGLKEHEALACTQGAIWNYSNGTSDPVTGKLEKVVGIYSTYKLTSSSGSEYSEYYREYDKVSDARMQLLFECLLGLEGEGKTTDVDDRNTITDMDLIIGDKVLDHVNNQDDDNTNDVYNTNVQFTVAIIPGDDDNITVAVLDGEGNVMKDADGKPIVKRLISQNSSIQDENAIRDDGNGTYTLSGLVFQENSDIKFDLKLEGLQHLNDKGVVIYQAYDGNGDGNDRNDSQTLVGLVDQVQNVDITKSMTLKFEVDENKIVTATSEWHDEKDYTPEQNDPPSDPEPNDPPQNDPPSNDGGNEGGNGGNGGGNDDEIVAVDTIEIEEADVPLSAMPAFDALEIEDDMIPLGVLPATGDNSLWFMFITLLSGLSLAGASLVDKMKNRKR